MIMVVGKFGPIIFPYLKKNGQEMVTLFERGKILASKTCCLLLVEVVKVKLD